jgi:hypothetical protein
MRARIWRMICSTSIESALMVKSGMQDTHADAHRLRRWCAGAGRRES